LYLDNAATSFPKPPQVLAAITRYATEVGASAGRGAYAEAVETGRLINECRERLCTLFNGEDANHFIFTLNCSDALNIAIKGVLLGPQSSALSPVHAICSHTDHNSVLRPLNALADAGVVEQTRVAVDPRTGLIDLPALRSAIRPNTKLIALAHASNVTGTLQPLREIGKLAREHSVLLVVDAAQSAGHVPIDVQHDHVDFLAAPGHKGLLGPLGTGFLYIRPGLEQRMTTIREGGTGSVSEIDRQPEFMPDRFEPGSHNAIGIAGLSAGVQWVIDRTVQSLREHELDLIRTFIDGVGDIPNLRYFGPQGVRDRVGVFSVAIDGIGPMVLAGRLENEFGILTRPGLHCAPLIHQAIGSADRGGTTRLSFGPFLSKQDVKFATDALAHIACERPRDASVAAKLVAR
jgi:cysteine desulfurase family protein